MPAVVAAALEYMGASAATAAWVSQVIVAVATIYATRETQRKALSAQKDAYNSSLRDRYVMSRGATEPRRLVLGRQRSSGPMFYIGSYGTNREHLVFCVPVAAHEIDAYEAIYFDDEQVTLDGSGNVLGVNRRELFSISAATGTFTLTSTLKTGTVTASARYGTTTVALTVTSAVGTSVSVSGAHVGETGTLTISYLPDPSPFQPNRVLGVVDTVALNGSGNGSVTLAHPPNAGTVNVTYGVGDGTIVDLTAYASVAGSVVTVTGAPAPYVSITASVSYQWTDGTTRARVRKYLGAAGQAADAGMIAALPGVWTSAHVVTDTAYLVVEFDYDPDAFPGGIPNVSALIRGAKVYDTRTGVTAWSENPALLIRHAATHALCGRLSSTLINDTTISAAANVCDTSAAYLVNGQTYTRAFYTAGLVVKSGTRAQDVLNDLSQAMAGRWAFVDGQLRVKAGSYATPLQALDETWIAPGAPVHIQPKANRADVINIVTGKFADEQSDYQILDYPRVASSAYIAEDGADLPLDMALNAVTFSGQAQQVVAAAMRDSRQGMRVTLLCNMRAYPVELFDTINVTLSRFGWTNKVFEVLDVAWQFDGGIQLTLKETATDTWALGTTFSGVDPAPNTSLRSPFDVPAVAALACASGTAQLQKQTDGTIMTRISATWTAITDAAVLASGGGVQIRFGLSTTPEDQWQTVEAPGDQGQAYLTNVKDGAIYLVKARAFNALVKGVWSAPVLHKVVGKSVAPGAVGSLTATAIPGFIRLTWTAGVEVDEAGVDLGRGASWAAATGLEGQAAKSFAAGVGVNSYDWAWPAAASYTVRAKRRDNSGNQSSEVTLSVTVTAAGIAIGTAQIADGAATDPFVTQVVSDSVTTGVSSVTDRTLASHVYTNSTGASVVVELSVSSERRVTVSGGYSGSVKAFAFLNVDVNGSNVGPPASGLYDTASLTASQVATWKESSVWSVTLANGDVLTSSSYCRLVPSSGSGNVTLDSYNVTLRGAVIKK